MKSATQEIFKDLLELDEKHGGYYVIAICAAIISILNWYNWKDLLDKVQADPEFKKLVNKD